MGAFFAVALPRARVAGGIKTGCRDAMPSLDSRRAGASGNVMSKMQPDAATNAPRKNKSLISTPASPWPGVWNAEGNGLGYAIFWG
ncbi:hypothetical protein CKAH01_13989 [Colletotrichum kahawae]|uniref:Uncharacterized protein n=1 Tax=Colletotrichum kahawae TaxID=34407 RepID=A0AAD9YLL2_COLKA|nr:hypothetical protein CKAH01_13989 [Colletotrichum kahawae]